MNYVVDDPHPMRDLPFPKSFPNDTELAFLQLLFCDDATFLDRYKQWEQSIVFDKIDYATSRLLPLLSRRLRNTTDQSEQTQKIHGLYKLAWVKNHRLIEALAHALPLLEDNGIPVLLLKGIPLLLNAYKDMGARFLGDADILISPGQTKRAIDILQHNGWTLKSAYFPRHQELSNDRLQHIIKEATFSNAMGTEIDLHWRIFDYFGAEVPLCTFDDLTTRSIPIQLRDRSERTLSPEDMLLHIIVHGAEGNVHRTLRWVTDAVALIQAYDVDWTRFLSLAEQTRWTVEVSMAFTFLLKHQFISLPASVATSIEQLPYDAESIKRYYKRANPPRLLLGSIPRLWRVYRTHEAPGAISTLLHFPSYLSLAWGLPRRRDLFSFAIQKYTSRIRTRLKRS